MCQTNCIYENQDGECRLPLKHVCPYGDDEDNHTDDDYELMHEK